MHNTHTTRGGAGGWGGLYRSDPSRREKRNLSFFGLRVEHRFRPQEGSGHQPLAPPPVPAFGMFAFLAFLLGVATTCTCIGSDPTPKLKTLGQADDEASKVAVWAALVGVTRASGRDPRSFIPSLVTGCGDWSSALRAPAEEEDRPRIRCTYTTKARGDDNVVEFTRARCGDAACWAFPKGDQTAVLMQGLTLTIYKPPPRKYSTRPSTNTSLPFAALARLQGALGRWIRPVLRDFFLNVWLQIFKVLNRSVLAVCGVARFAEFWQVHEPNGVQRHRFDLFLSSGPTFLLRHTKGRSPFGGVAQCGVEWSAQCVWRGAVCMRRLEFST